MEQLEQSRISRREGGTRAGSRASQGVNYARKQYYRTNYRTGERNSVKCRAAHYQPPLPRECTPRYINYLGGWPIGQIQRETTVLSPLLFPPLYFFFFFFFLFFQFFNFIPLLPFFHAFLLLYPLRIGDEALTEIFNRLENFFSIVHVRYYQVNRTNLFFLLFIIIEI